MIFDDVKIHRSGQQNQPEKLSKFRKMNKIMNKKMFFVRSQRRKLQRHDFFSFSIYRVEEMFAMYLSLWSNSRIVLVHLPVYPVHISSRWSEGKRNEKGRKRDELVGCRKRGTNENSVGPWDWTYIERYLTWWMRVCSRSCEYRDATTRRLFLFVRYGLVSLRLIASWTVRGALKKGATSRLCEQTSDESLWNFSSRSGSW